MYRNVPYYTVMYRNVIFYGRSCQPASSECNEFGSASFSSLCKYLYCTEISGIKKLNINVNENVRFMLRGNCRMGTVRQSTGWLQAMSRQLRTVSLQLIVWLSACILWLPEISRSFHNVPDDESVFLAFKCSSLEYHRSIVSPDII